jgi:hypothetical protein
MKGSFKHIILIFIFLAPIGCSDLSSRGAVNLAHKYYNNGKYQKAISKALHSINKYEYSPKHKAELYYLVAESYGELRDHEKEQEMYQFVVENYPGTKYVFLAEAALKSNIRVVNQQLKANGQYFLSTLQRNRSYPPHLEEGGQCFSPTQQQKLWALATCAILTESNRRNHNLLGGCERSPKEIEGWKKSLKKWWGVRNMHDLLETLYWIKKGGHRKQFDGIAENLSTANLVQIADLRKQFADDPSFNNRIDVVLKHKDEFGPKSITAWDYARYVSLCGWGYIAGYLTEEEAWKKIMPAAKVLQKTFDSWEDLGKNHVIGREFWSLKHTQRKGELTRKCYNRLLTEPSSPWRKLPWDLNLDSIVPEGIDKFIEKQIREVFKEYIEALKKQNVNKYRYLISNQSIKAGEGGVKPFQMKNQYRQVSNNPYIVKISKDRKEAVLTFKYSRKGTANPYILIYEDSRWKVDLTQMWKRIRFGPMNKWYWVDKWNK